MTDMLQTGRKNQEAASGLLDSQLLGSEITSDKPCIVSLSILAKKKMIHQPFNVKVTRGKKPSKKLCRVSRCLQISPSEAMTKPCHPDCSLYPAPQGWKVHPLPGFYFRVAADQNIF